MKTKTKFPLIRDRGAARGRPSLLTPKCEAKLLEGIKSGLPLKHAALLAGVSYDTFNRWRRRGENPLAPPEFHHFCKAVERAQAVAVSKFLAMVKKAGKSDWKAAVWMLERRFPDEFGKCKEETKPGNSEALPSSQWSDHSVIRDIKERERLYQIFKEIHKRMEQNRRLKKEENECRTTWTDGPKLPPIP